MNKMVPVFKNCIYNRAHIRKIQTNPQKIYTVIPRSSSVERDVLENYFVFQTFYRCPTESFLFKYV